MVLSDVEKGKGRSMNQGNETNIGKKCKRCGEPLTHMPAWASWCRKCLEEEARKNPL
jgi:hypothetical protein